MLALPIISLATKYNATVRHVVFSSDIFELSNDLINRFRYVTELQDVLSLGDSFFSWASLCVADV